MGRGGGLLKALTDMSVLNVSVQLLLLLTEIDLLLYFFTSFVYLITKLDCR